MSGQPVPSRHHYHRSSLSAASETALIKVVDVRDLFHAAGIQLAVMCRHNEWWVCIPKEDFWRTTTSSSALYSLVHNFNTCNCRVLQGKWKLNSAHANDFALNSLCSCSSGHGAPSCTVAAPRSCVRRGLHALHGDSGCRTRYAADIVGRSQWFWPGFSQSFRSSSNNKQNK